MPNWTTNYIRFQGPEETMDRLVEAVTNLDEYGYGDLDFGAFIPEPQYGTDQEWYDWRCAHWGTKWKGSDAQILEREEGAVTMIFNTAWSEPAAFLDHMEEKEGVKIIGGFIHEDGMEFEQWIGCSEEEFDRYFIVVEENMEDDDDYSWVNRYLYALSKEERESRVKIGEEEEQEITEEV